MKASIETIETLGLVDGPGIRTVLFFSGCKLRCKYCHNPELWNMKNQDKTIDEVVNKAKRYKPYYKNMGGVTLSGGEPLLHGDFIIELSKKLKEENINIALDTSGVGNGNYINILENIDIVLLDIKHVTREGYKEITGNDIDESLKFITELNKLNKRVWIRQVIVPGITDNIEYIKLLKQFLKQVKNIEKIEFLPYHKLGDKKYIELQINNPYQDKKEMDIDNCRKLFEEFTNLQ